MAINQGPLMSLEARGGLGGSLTFGKWRGRQFTKRTPRGVNRRSLGQMWHRAYYSALCAWWSALPDADKQAWSEMGAAAGYTQFNAYLATNLPEKDTDEAPRTVPSPAGPLTAEFEGHTGISYHDKAVRFSADLISGISTLGLVVVGLSLESAADAMQYARAAGHEIGNVDSHTVECSVLNFKPGTYYWAIGVADRNELGALWYSPGTTVEIP